MRALYAKEKDEHEVTKTQLVEQEKCFELLTQFENQLAHEKGEHDKIKAILEQCHKRHLETVAQMESDHAAAQQTACDHTYSIYIETKQLLDESREENSKQKEILHHLTDEIDQEQKSHAATQSELIAAKSTITGTCFLMLQNERKKINLIKFHQTLH